MVRQLQQRGSKFVRCYGDIRPPRYARGWHTLRSVWAATPYVEKPAFKIYRFKRGAWPEMILQAVMRAARDSEIGKERASEPQPLRIEPNGHDTTSRLFDQASPQLAAPAPRPT